MSFGEHGLARWDRVQARILALVNGVNTPAGRSDFEVLPWSLEGPTLTMRWSGGGRVFAETLRFPASVSNESWVPRVIDLLAAISGLSYAKALAPTSVSVDAVQLTDAGASLVRSAFGDGMAEFAHHTNIASPVEMATTQTIPDAPLAAPSLSARPLIPLGGGRDSAVVACALEPDHPIHMSIGGSDSSRRVAAALGRELVVVDRIIDDQILEMNAAGAPNGHIPITAITMLISVVCAASLGADVVVMANEASASSPTRVVDGVAINHQHSKSHVFELLLRDALVSVGSGVPCVSALRNQSDTEISRVFARKCSVMHEAVVSCNRAGLRDSTRRSTRWCGDCAKCRSVFLSLAPHMTPRDLSQMFGHDLLADRTQMHGFSELLDVATKPFECVQTVDEARAALWVLAGSPDWAGHAVVAELANRGAPLTPSAPTALGEHVPERIRAAMESFFS